MNETVKLPFGVDRIHFVGIGGAGMSGIAEVMRNLGYDVRGSDLSESAAVRRLRALGAHVDIGQSAENLRDAQVVVASTAIRDDNPEIVAARAAGVPIVRRAEMLAELMRFKRTVCVAGSHGKTTTTSLVAAALDAGPFDPTVINGGVIEAYGANARMGASAWMVVEADESDGSFNRLPATVAVITNIDPEHLDYWGDFDALRAGFRQFVESIPFYGFAAICADDAEARALAHAVDDRRVVTYGFDESADLRIVDYVQEGTTIRFSLERRADGRRIDGLRLTAPGAHMARNAAAAATVALELGVDDEALREAFGGFRGVRRRFTHVGAWRGVEIIDDYGHHPTEIAAVLKAARDAADGRVLAVVQPHRFTRLRDAFEGFASCMDDADRVLVADVYAAGESPIAGVDSDALADALKMRGHPDASRLTSWDDLAPRVHEWARRGDLVLCLGAGDVTKYAQGLADALADVEARAA